MKSLLMRLVSAILAAWIFAQPCLALEPNSGSAKVSAEALQAAEILGVKEQVERLIKLQSDSQISSSNSELLALKSLILRRVLLGYLELRRACNKVDMELTYSYGVLRKEHRKELGVYQFLNTLTFTQFGVFYTLEPFSRIHNQFVQSACMTTISASLGTLIPLTGIVYGKLAKASHPEPPKFISHIVQAGPVDAEGLPAIVEQFMNLPEPGSPKTRKEEMYSLWKRRYGVDASKKETLCSLIDGKAKSIDVLNTRVLLLWSLHTFVQDFDHELLALLKVIRQPSSNSATSSNLQSADQNIAGLNESANEAAKLLKVQSQVNELISLNSGAQNSDRKRELEILIQEKILHGALEIRLATDKVDEEMNYAADVVLNQLLTRRGKRIQRNYEVNFIQAGILTASAGGFLLHRATNAAFEQFIVAGSIGDILSGLGLALTHGGWRKIDTGPNSLADFMNLHPAEEYRFSPLVAAFLNAPMPGANGKSRREDLIQIWKDNKASSLSLDKTRNLEKLAAMPSVKADSIKMVSDRFILLGSLKARLEHFDSELFALLQATDAPSPAVSESRLTSLDGSINGAAAEAAKLLNSETYVNRLSEYKRKGLLNSAQDQVLDDQLALSRKILAALLEVRTMSDNLDQQIIIENQIMDRMKKTRAHAVQLTNLANFFQINTLSIISNGLNFTSDKNPPYHGYVINIVSALSILGLTGLAVLEDRGGYRPEKAPPNSLSYIFDLETPAEYRVSPMLWRFLNSPAPNSPTASTRRQELLMYWKQAKMLNIDLSRKSTIERVSVQGSSHHWWNESIKLMQNRIDMLYNLRAMVDFLDIGLSDLLSEVD